MKKPVNKGVAENKTYKNMYHFNDNFFDGKTKKELPSVDAEDSINSTIKENPYTSNVEIEGDEVVLQPDLTALFKAKGKKHKSGGMDVYLKPESFVFSNDKSLALTQQECELFEFKKGGTYGKHEAYTPAEILKKNVNPKHYNTMVNNISDVKKDDLVKKSSALMLQKYIGTLGNIAYLQEKKKNFPQGIPEFSQDAPVYASGVKSEIDAQKQYAKYGGTIDLPKAQWGGFPSWMKTSASDDDIRRAALRHRAKASQNMKINSELPSNWGLWPGDRLSAFQDRYKMSNAADKINDLNALSTQLGYTGPKDNKSFQKWLYNSSPENKAIIDKWHQKYNVGPTGGMFDGKIGVRWTNALNEITNKPQGGPPNKYSLTGPFGIYGPGTPTEEDKLPSPNDVTGDAQGVKRADWEFSPWQKISQLHNWAQYFGAKKYDPMRSQMRASYIDPSLVNPEQTIGDLKGAAAQQTGSLSTLNPILRNAQAQSIYGQELNTIPQVRSQYDNQNAQITNRAREQNTQIHNNVTEQNVAHDNEYYRASIEGQVHFDNMKNFLANQAMSGTLKDVETNQTLAYNLLTRNNPAYGYDWRTGTFTRNKKDIRDVYNSSQGDYLQNLLKDIDFKGLDNTQKINYIRELQRGKALQYLPQSFGTTPPPFEKRGGIVNPYRGK